MGMDFKSFASTKGFTAKFETKDIPSPACTPLITDWVLPKEERFFHVAGSTPAF